MPKRNKYDILEKELRNSTKNVLSLVFFTLSVTKKLDSPKLDEKQKDELFLKASKRLFPVAKVLAHIGYENTKDIKSVDEATLVEYLESRKISKEDFLYNYETKQTEIVQILTIFALLDKKQIDVSNISNPELLYNLISYEPDFDYIDSLDELNEYEYLLDEVFSDEFNISNMSQELKDLVDSYHESYMNTKIYPNVNKELKEKNILNVAKSYGK